MKQKLIALLLVMCLCLSLLAGCGDKVDTSTDAPKQTGENQDDKTTDASTTTDAADAEPTKLTLWVPDVLMVEDWETNKQTLWLEEQGNFDLEFIPLAQADYMTKVGTALTVGAIEDLPDIVLGGAFKSTSVWEYAQAETIIPLTDYYKDPELAVNINKQIENCGVDYTKLAYFADGNIYTVPSYNQSSANEYPDKFWIYKPWLDALGEDIPETTEEFYQLLKKVKETDLNGNGKQDEIPMLGATKTYTGYFDALMNSFAYTGGLKNTIVSEEGVVSAAFATEGYKDGLAYIEKLFDEGLIIAETLTMDKTQANALLGNEEQLVFCLVYNTPNAAKNADDYIAILPMEAPNGDRYATYEESIYAIRFLVTANCKDPEAAFRLGDLLSSEFIGIQSRYGEEGVHWDYAKNVDTSSMVPYMEGWEPSIVVYNNDAFWDSEVQNSSWYQYGPFVRNYGVVNGQMIDPATVSQRQTRFCEAVSMYQDAALYPTVIRSLNFTDEELEMIADIETALMGYVAEFRDNVFAGNINLDEAWDSYLKELDKIGLDEWLKVYQAAYDRMNK